MAGFSLRCVTIFWIFIILATCTCRVLVKDSRDFKIVKTPGVKMLPLIGWGRSTVNASSLTECAVRCRQRSQECFSFTYNNKDEKCLLGSWSAAKGAMYSELCVKGGNSSNFIHQKLGSPSKKGEKLYTSACCQGEFLLRTTNMAKPKCLYYPIEELNFTAAQADCESRKSQLVTFRTKLEMDTVQDLLHCQDDTWIGLRDNCDNSTVDCSKNRTFFWLDGTELSRELSDIVTSGFDNYRDIEGCVQLGGTYSATRSFNDAQCSHSYHYVCEKDPFYKAKENELHC